MLPFSKALFVATAILVSLGSRSVFSTDQLVGEWQLVSAELTIGDTTFPTFDSSTHQMIKIFTDSHFAYMSKGPVRPHFSSYALSNEEKITAYDNFGGGGGRYTVNGSSYTEHVDYCSFPNYEGKSLTFSISIDRDTLVQEGKYPLIALGLGDKDGYVKEVYKRIR